jgi:hypothetical protein
MYEAMFHNTKQETDIMLYVELSRRLNSMKISGCQPRTEPTFRGPSRSSSSRIRSLMVFETSVFIRIPVAADSPRRFHRKIMLICTFQD